MVDDLVEAVKKGKGLFARTRIVDVFRFFHRVKPSKTQCFIKFELMSGIAQMLLTDNSVYTIMLTKEQIKSYVKFEEDETYEGASHGSSNRQFIG